MALRAVVDEVNAGIEILVVDFAVRGYIGAPLRRVVSDDVVSFPGKLLQPRYLRLRVGVGKRHAQRSPSRLSWFLRLARCRLAGLGEDQDCFG